MINVKIQIEPFNSFAEQSLLQNVGADVGAIVEFTGYVRQDIKRSSAISGIFLEHYPGMAEKAITDIVNQCFIKWQLKGVSVIHRIGYLSINEPIVYVAVASSHRKEALQAVDFVMDFLKNDVPIWKKEIVADNEYWVDQKVTDIAAKQAWSFNE